MYVMNLCMTLKCFLYLLMHDYGENTFIEGVSNECVLKRLVLSLDVMSIIPISLCHRKQEMFIKHYESIQNKTFSVILAM